MVPYCIVGQGPYMESRFMDNPPPVDTYRQNENITFRIVRLRAVKMHQYSQIWK